MDAAVPWRYWQQLLHDEKDGASAALNAIASFLQHKAASESAREALDGLWRLWCVPTHDCDGDLAEILLLTAVASGLERVLVSKLLQFHPADALRDVGLFLDVLEKWGDAASIPTRTLRDQLRPVVDVLLASHAPSGGDCLDSGREIDQDNDVMAWEEFVALPSGLDRSGLVNTKIGRSLHQHLNEIAKQQQWRLEHQGDSIFDALRIIAERLPESNGQPQENGSHIDISSCWKLEECEDTAALLRYLEAGIGQSADSMVSPTGNDAILLPDSDMPSSTIGDLLKKLESTVKGNPTYDQFATRLVAELDTIEDQLALSVQAALLLKWQRARGEMIANGVTHPTAMAWERNIRKQVNSLTNFVDGDDQMLNLLRFAAVHPTAVIDALTTSALATSQYDVFVCNLLWLCPMLGRWQLDNKTSLPQLLELLEADCTRLVNQTDQETPLHEAPVMKLVLALSGCGELTEQYRVVIEPDVLFNSVLWANFTPTGDASKFTSVIWRFELVHQFVMKLSVHKLRLSSSTIRRSLDTVIRQYCEALAGDLNTQGELSAPIELRDVALFLVRGLLMLWPLESTREWATSSEAVLKKHPDAAFDSLLQSILHQSPPKVPIDQSVLSGELRSAIHKYLWFAVWMSETSNSSNFISELKLWSSFELLSPSGATVTGAIVIQAELTKMLMGIGTRTFNQMVKIVRKILIPALHAGESLSSEPPGDPQLPAPSLIEVTFFLTRCWAIVAFASNHVRFQTVLRILARTMNLLEEAIEISSADSSALLRCLELVGLLWCWIQTNNVTWGTVNRLENTAIRVLFLLESQPSASPPLHGRATPESIAKVLASTQLLNSDGVKRFLQSKALGA